jgi:hypothetical protein
VSHSPARRSRKAQFVAWMANRFFLRFHMTVILGLTFLAGLGVTKLFLDSGNTNLALRYGTAVAASYVVFLLLLKAWLWYIDDRESVDAGDVVDAVDIASDFLQSTGRDGAVQFQGGSFGGGGSSGSFGDGGASALADLGSDEDGCALAVVVMIVVAVVGIALSALYLIYAAPAILAEAAFEAILASSLLRGARKAESPGWVGGVVSATALPFLAMFVLATGFGWFANEHCPEARRVADVLECARLH